jgi:hypothetical protein
MLQTAYRTVDLAPKLSGPFCPDPVSHGGQVMLPRDLGGGRLYLSFNVSVNVGKHSLDGQKYLPFNVSVNVGNIV